MDLRELGKNIRGLTYNMNKYLEEKVAPLGIGHGQFEYFTIIATHPGINQNEIAKMKNVGKASVTKAINILEKKGYIVRQVNKTDKRNYQLFCTEKGNELIDGFVAYISEIKTILFRDVAADQIEIFLHVLGKMYDNSNQLIKDETSNI